MQSSLKSRRILCINCRICVNTLRRFIVFDLNTKVISVFSEWLSPIIITNDDYVCEACYEIAMRTVNEITDPLSIDGESVGSSRQVGHTQVCLLCGRSLLNRQKHLIYVNNPSHIEIRIFSLIEERIAPRQIMATDQTCHTCWVSVKRSAERQQQIDVTQAQDYILPKVKPVYVEQHIIVEQIKADEMLAQAEVVLKIEPVDMEQDVIVEQSGADKNQSRANKKQGGADKKQSGTDKEQLKNTVTGQINLPNYRRAANTASHCLIPGCANMSLHNITDSLRVIILHSHHYYIPIHARICQEHLFHNDWDTLYNSDKSISTFTVAQVEHNFSFVNAVKPCLDFRTIESIENIEDNLFFYWTGQSKQDFVTLLNEVPHIQEVHNGLLGLASLVIKLKTGDSNERLSTLLSVPRQTLERLMKNVREILLKDYSSNNLVIQLKPREKSLNCLVTKPGPN